MLCSKSLTLRTKSYFKITFFLAIVDAILSLGWIGATLCLLYGVHKKEKNKFLLPLLWFLPFELVVRLFCMLILITYFLLPIPVRNTVPVEALVSLEIICRIIFWLCVHSHRKQLISNNENHQHSSGYASKD